MTELGTRSGSQILRTFLPQQTADLNASMAAAQAQNDAANAATVQTEYQFNTIYSNPNQ